MEPTRSVRPFEVVSEYEPSGDQPAAIAELAGRINAGETDVVLLGATGTGKSATTAWLVEQVQRPTLVLAHNKTLAAQLANEFREMFPHNAVEYFVSYYDYYQPEAYVPQTDTFIEKDSSINAEVERLRHSTTNSLLSRRDVIVVSTVSCIYGLGTPEGYLEAMIALQVGQHIDRETLIRRFVSMQYQRNDIDFSRGNFRVRGDTIEIIPMYEELAIRIEMFGDEIEALYAVSVFPGSHYVAGTDVMHRAIGTIKDELATRLAELDQQGKLLESQRLRMRTTFDLEMMEQIGFCNGIENYSAHIDGRGPGEAPHCLLDYFPDDLLVVIDESHVTVPQIGAMYEGDASRKRTLVDHGFRLPSALDNRPLKFEEFLDRVGQKVYLSATPGKYELGITDSVVEQIIRPTGLIDPQIVVKPSEGQIDDLLDEIRTRTDRDERVLVTTLTKKMAEELTDFLTEAGVRVRYLHSDVDTLRRVELLTELRQGLRRPRRHQPPPGGPRPARGVARRHPRRRQGRLPPVVHVAHPDDRSRGAQRLRRGPHVRRRHDQLDEASAGGDRPSPRQADRLQHRARHRPPTAPQEDRRHHGGARSRGRRHGGPPGWSRRQETLTHAQPQARGQGRRGGERPGVDHRRPQRADAPGRCRAQVRARRAAPRRGGRP
jgi:excinuclease ABC subunit B